MPCLSRLVVLQRLLDLVLGVPLLQVLLVRIVHPVQLRLQPGELPLTLLLRVQRLVLVLALTLVGLRLGLIIKPRRGALATESLRALIKVEDVVLTAERRIRLFHTDVHRSRHTELHTLNCACLDFVGASPCTLCAGGRLCIQSLQLQSKSVHEDDALTKSVQLTSS